MWSAQKELNEGEHQTCALRLDKRRTTSSKKIQSSFSFESLTRISHERHHADDILADLEWTFATICGLTINSNDEIDLEDDKDEFVHDGCISFQAPARFSEVDNLASYENESWPDAMCQ